MKRNLFEIYHIRDNRYSYWQHLILILQVIARIFYEVNRSWSGKITVSELRRSRSVFLILLILIIFNSASLRFLSTLRLLQDEDDINQVGFYFEKADLNQRQRFKELKPLVWND